MKREFLFKGKRADNGEWVEGYYGVSIKGKHYIESVEPNVSISHYIVLPETVCQFTGLTDKNRVKIFEGDILKTDSGDIVEVRYESTYASFGIWKKGWVFLHYFHEAVEPENCGIISNIHENQELINN